MRNLKFRSNPSLVTARHGRQRHRGWWLVPLLILGTGALYAALQGDETAQSPPPSVDDTAAVLVPLDLPPAPHSDRLALAPKPAVNTDATPSTAITVPDTPVAEASPAIAPPPGSPETEATPDTGDTGTWLVHQIKSGDTLSKIFKRLGLSPTLLHQIIHSGDDAKQLARIKPGQTLRIRLDPDEQFAELMWEIDRTRSLRVRSDGETLSTVTEQRETTRKNNRVSAVIESSLFEGAQKAGLSDAMTMALADIFAWDIDFALEIRTGDRFSVVYAEEWLDGEKLGDGPILAAEFINRGKSYRALRFEDEEGHASYYSPDGKSMRKAFLRAPVDFRRISSRFQQERWHPVLGKKRPHRGVDYAAAIGTPIKAAGDGKVLFKGRKGGYGKTVILQHGSKYTTLYGHLNGYRKGLRNGGKIRQGQVIGYVGKTGLATGPHLHYEFRINGVHHNPLTVKLPAAQPLPKKHLPTFRQASKGLLAELDSMSRTQVADAK